MQSSHKYWPLDSVLISVQNCIDKACKQFWHKYFIFILHFHQCHLDSVNSKVHCYSDDHYKQTKANIKVLEYGD